MAGFLKKLFGSSERTVPEPTPGSAVGILTGLFAATPEQFAAWDLNGLTPTDWPAVEFKRLESVRLGTLEAILTARNYDDVDQDQLHNVVRDGGDEGPWVIPVRPALTAALADLTPERAGSVASAWADTDEFKARPTDRPGQEDIRALTGLLVEIADIARFAHSTDRYLYLLMSLRPSSQPGR
jgi:hypothetical protein